MIKVYVIAPDKSSGLVFCDVLRKKGIDAEFNFHKIRPRVYENKITTSKDVVDDLNKIFKSFNDTTKSVVIACNTLQLWLDDIDVKYKKNAKVYTTFEACNWKFNDLKVKPIWLGTTPLVQKTTNFPTLISYGRSEMQELVQELIWRIKMYEGDEHGTAPEIVKRDSDNKVIQKLKISKIKNEILSCLHELRIKYVITGCTELPMIFDKTKIEGINFIDPAEVLAEYIKSQSVAIFFAGGTISSIANKNGLRIGGKSFDLLEKLADRLPGSFKNLNVTKNDIIYQGFSENMTVKNHFEILAEIQKILKTGVSRIVITHGTDSMEQTALFLYKRLNKTLRNHKIVLVMTGSNDHAGSSETDAWDNLSQAINEEKKFRKGGVFIAFHNRFISANRVSKEFFDGIEMNYVDTNSLSYQFGLRKYNKWKDLMKKKISQIYFKDKENITIYEYNVNVIRTNHKEFIKKIKAKRPDAVLFILYHSSTANVTSKDASVADLIRYLKSNFITSFGITENGDPIDLNKYESSVELSKAGLIPIF